MNTIIKSKTLIDNSSKLIISRIEKFVKKENDYKKRIEELERENKELKMKNKNLIASVQTDEIHYYNRFDENGNLYIREADEHIKDLNEKIKSLDEITDELESDLHKNIDQYNELINEYNYLVEKNDKSEKQLKKLTKELKESKKINKDLHNQCYITHQWFCDQTEHCEDNTTTTSFRELCNYFESWAELVYGRNFEIDRLVFLQYLINFQIINYGWDDKINGSKTNPKINIIIKDD